MPEPEDAAVERARAGDADAFRQLVERHSRGVYRLALRVTGNCQDAEDVVQETFLKAYRQLARFESRASFGTWVHRIAMNCAVDVLRNRPRREQAEEDETLEQMATSSDGGPHAMSPERLMESLEVGERVTQAMTGLSALERAAFVPEGEPTQLARVARVVATAPHPVRASAVAQRLGLSTQNAAAVLRHPIFIRTADAHYVVGCRQLGSRNEVSAAEPV